LTDTRLTIPYFPIPFRVVFRYHHSFIELAPLYSYLIGYFRSYGMVIIAIHKVDRAKI
jgi:hypothetical protein